jgi:hypothetical protein
MKLIQKSLAGLGGIVLAAILLAALAPKATRGVAAALVQVTNTSANPVPNRDVDNGPRQAVSLVASANTELADFQLADDRIEDYVVPAGKRLVVEFISGTIRAPAGAHISDAFLLGATSSGEYADHLSPNLITAGDFNIYQVSQPIRAYYDAGKQIQASVPLTSGSFPLVIFTLRGYLVDCTGGCS